MINYYRNSGSATLIIVVILLLSASLLITYFVGNNVLRQKIITNQYVTLQALNAAEAGLRFGAAYLEQNSSTIIDSAVNGLINYGAGNEALTNVNQADGSTFSIIYTNPIANDYELLQITATGKSVDGATTRIIVQQIAGIPLSTFTITTRGDVTFSGSGANVTGFFAIHAGGGVKSGVTDSSNNLVVQNDSSLANLTNDQFFIRTFNATPTNFMATLPANQYYDKEQDVAWDNAGSGLNGQVWVNGPATISGQTVVGLATNPVLLIVNGNLQMNGLAKIYGAVYVRGSISFTAGTPEINGVLISESTVNLRGIGKVNYNPAIARSLLGLIPSILHGYAFVSGSWRDF